MSISNHSRRPAAALAPLRPGAVALAPPRPGSAILGVGGILARLGRGLAAYVRAYAQAYGEQRRARATERRLMALSNRELKDIGLCRSEILSVVYGPERERKVKYHADA